MSNVWTLNTQISNHNKWWTGGFVPDECSLTNILWYKKQEGLAVASIARDDPSRRAHWTINSSVLMPACTATTMRGKLASEFET